MKMPRSHCESENVQFVQELAEVDGPFESPIDINFKDLAKLELPSLVWNKCSVPPKKMKITNTGHTVIISGKWKSERPYLTGGPLLGKYVFSQIHFHWGQDERKGSEHQICGEGFPLEMHVAHFKAEYATQENALREKDGMLVIVYLFKIQEEPNACLKSIISLLPFIHQPSTSHHIDPRPILSLCNPFTDDYFMYWGSVVTSTCAHILLWIVSREPFGISREQVNEFRKILDASQQPIHRNSRDLQPLHKRNVFHVNASKYLDCPLLPIKKILRCFCRGSEDNNVYDTDCSCRSYRNQEEFQGGNVENLNFSQNRDCTGKKAMDCTGLPKDFRMQKTTFVHSATIQSNLRLLKKFDSDQAANMYYTESVPLPNPEANSKLKLVSHSCCFVPNKELCKNKKRLEKRKNRDSKKKNFDSVKALGHILNSLETIKNHTFKKLKEIESINEEIKGIKSYCSETEDKKWLRTIEKIMSRQKRFTIKASRGCFNELKNLAKECNFDKLFDKNFPVGDNSLKMLWENVNEAGEQVQGVSNEDLKNVKDIVLLEKLPLSQLSVNKAIKFSNKAQKLLESFFEDIKESEDLQQSVQKDLKLKKMNSFYKKQAGDSISVNKLFNENFITQKLFNLVNLEGRFFTEVVTEDRGMVKKNVDVGEEGSENRIPLEEEKTQTNVSGKESNVKSEENGQNLAQSNNEGIIPLRRANIAVLLSHETQPELEKNSNIFSTLETYSIPHLNTVSGTEASSESELEKPDSKCKTQPQEEFLSNIIEKKEKSVTSKSLLKDLVSANFFRNLKYSTSSTSTTESSEAHRRMIGKLHKKLNKSDVWERKYSTISKSSLRRFSNYKKHKLKNINFDGYYLKKKKSKNKRKKICKGKRCTKEMNYSKGSSTTTSKEALKHVRKKPKWEKHAKPRLDLDTKKSNEKSKEYSALSPERKKLKYNYQKTRQKTHKKGQQKEQSLLTSSDSEWNVDYKKNTEKHHRKYENDAKELICFKKRDAVDVAQSPRVSLYKSIEYSEKSVQQENLSKEAIKESLDKKKCEESNVKEISNQEDYLPFKQIQIESLRAKILQSAQPKLSYKNKSLTNLTNKNTHKLETNQRVFVENLEKRQKTARESFKFFKKIKNRKILEENIKIKNFDTETSKKIEEDDKEKVGNLKEGEKVHDVQSSKIIEYKVGVYTTSSLIDKEFVPKTQKLDIERYTAITKKENKGVESGNTKTEEVKVDESKREESKGSCTPEVNPAPVEPIFVASRATDRTQHPKFVLGNKSSSQKRQNSENNSTLLEKPSKGKVKKRLHYNKRNLKYHLKKSPSIFRKHEKTESKCNSLLLLTEEEQLKIISENVVRYLKRQLTASKCNFELGKNGSSQKLGEDSLNNSESSSEKKKTLNYSDLPKPTDSKIQKNFSNRNFQGIGKDQYKNMMEKQKEKETFVKTPTETTKKVSLNPQKPANNFIKLNKLMAGKYRRMRPMENQPEKEKLKNNTSIVKPLQKKKEKFSFSEGHEQKFKTLIPVTSSNSSGRPSLIGKPPKQNQKKSQLSVKLDDLNSKKLKKDSLLRKPQMESPSNFQDITPMKRWVPTYMLTSYMTNPLEIRKPKKSKFDRYLMNMQAPHFVTDAFFDKEAERNERPSNGIVPNELEYLLNLQMCLNNEISAKVENSMNRVKNILSQDQNEIGLVEKTSGKSNLEFFEPCNKKIVVIEANKLVTNSSAEYFEDLKKPHNNNGIVDQKLKFKDVTNTKAVKESGDSELIISPTRESENQDYNSDSSYNCEILITLNSESNEKETEFHDSKNCNREPKLEIIKQDSENYDNSILSKPQRKKRKENEISTEMKQKLLEILEGEIKREMGLSYKASLENLSEEVSLKWKNPDCGDRSQSSGTSSDNTEVLAEISETMKQYLSNLKQRCLATRRKNKEKKKRKEKETS